MSIAVDVVTAGIDLMAKPEACRRRQVLYARRAAFLMRRYVPLRESILRSSEPVNSDYAAGILTWNTPYAARQYYEPGRHDRPLGPGDDEERRRRPPRVRPPAVLPVRGWHHAQG